MQCSSCGASVFAGDAACSECGAELASPPSPPPGPAATAPAEPPPVVADEEPVPETAARCPEHPAALSASTCSRCGRFCCLQCIPEPSRTAVCPACHRRVRSEQNPVELKRVRREVKVSFFFAAGVSLIIGVALPLLLAGRGVNASWLLVGAVLTASLGLCATVYAFTMRAAFAWTAVALEALASVALFIIVEGKCLGWPLVLFPIVTVFRLYRLGSLTDEAAQLSAPQ